MWNPFKKKTDKPLTDEIEAVLRRMHEVGVESLEYAKLVTIVTRLYELKTKSGREPVSKDTIAMIFGNLAGILVIVLFERNNVITTKALNQLFRPRT